MDLSNAKICMIAHTFYDADGRVQRYAETLASTCRQVDVICLRDGSQPLFKVKNGVRIFKIPFNHRSIKRSGYFIEYSIAFFLFSLWISALFIKHRYHLIHVHNMPDFLVFTALLPKLFGARLILDIHDAMPEIYLSKYRDSRKSLGLTFTRFQEVCSASFADAVITANHLFKEAISRRGIPPEKITVVNNVAEGRIFDRAKHTRTLSEQNHSFTLMYVGTIAHRYGLEIPIRAMPTLIAQIPDIRLIIIGSLRDGVKELPALVDQLDVASHVQFLPPLPFDEIPSQLAQADVGIYTALSDPHMSIATPTKVLEYTAMGLPTIASRLPILEDLYKQGGIQFFEPGNPEDFARSVIDLYRNPDKRADLIRTADMSHPQNIAWDKERKAYLNLLRQLLGNDRGKNNRGSKKISEE